MSFPPGPDKLGSELNLLGPDLNLFPSEGSEFPPEGNQFSAEPYSLGYEGNLLPSEVNLLASEGGKGAFRCFELNWPGVRPGGRLTSLLRQRSKQERRPASPVIRYANDCPALLTPGGRRGTRPSGSDSRAGLPRLPFRCSAGRNGLLPSTEPLRKDR